MSLALKVESYSGHKADERPLRFSMGKTSEAAGAAALPNGETPAAALPRTYEVREVLDQWYGPGYQCFKVRAEDGNLYILRHTCHEDTWTLDSFRSTSK